LQILHNGESVKENKERDNDSIDKCWGFGIARATNCKDVKDKAESLS
jgi:hypothetical protein